MTLNAMTTSLNSTPQVLAVIVLYKCRIVQSSTVRSLLTQSCCNASSIRVIVYDNSPTADSTDLPATWEYISDTSNRGLANAYNCALAYAQRYALPWLLLLDQDSILPPDFISGLETDIRSVTETPEVVAIIPRVFADGKQVSPVAAGFGLDRPLPRTTRITGQWLAAINSAATIKVSFLQSLGGFCLIFWLDYLDHWLFRAIYDARRRILVSNIQIGHNLSVANFNHNLSLTRYQNILTAEAAFTNGFLPFYWRPLLAVRFLARAIKHLAQTENKRFSLLMLRAACVQAVCVFRRSPIGPKSPAKSSSRPFDSTSIDT